MKIKLKEYERIHRIINAIVVSEKADPLVACTFFAFYGAHILKEHHKLNAEAHAGLAAYHMGGNNDVIVFGERTGNEIAGSMNGFHCWVEVEGWAIDFMAPLFPAIAKKFNSDRKFPVNMFQKPLGDMAEDFNALTKGGDFYYGNSTEILNDRIRYLSSSKVYSDLAEICSRWYKKPPKAIPSAIKVADGKGNMNSVELPSVSVVGAW